MKPHDIAHKVLNIYGSRDIRKVLKNLWTPSDPVYVLDYPFRINPKKSLVTLADVYRKQFSDVIVYEKRYVWEKDHKPYMYKNIETLAPWY